MLGNEGCEARLRITHRRTWWVLGNFIFGFPCDMYKVFKVTWIWTMTIFACYSRVSFNGYLQRIPCCTHPYRLCFDRFCYSTHPCMCFALQEDRQERCCKVARRMVAFCLSNVSATFWSRIWGSWIDLCWQNWWLVSGEKYLSDTYCFDVWSAPFPPATYLFHTLNTPLRS